jgi:hypothetical protein
MESFAVRANNSREGIRLSIPLPTQQTGDFAVLRQSYLFLPMPVLLLL